MSDSSSPAVTTPAVKAPKSKNGLPSRNACLACRAQKTRCNPIEGSDKCARCSKHDLDCVHKKHCRGPKRKNPSPEQDAPAAKRQATEAATDSTTISDHPPSPVVLGLPQSNERTVLPVERPEPTSYSLDTILSGSRVDDEVKDPIVEEYTDHFDDPVDLKMLSEHKAETMFAFFHERMNCYLAVFDPVLHSARYVRHSSSLLYTAILAVTSKFMFRAIYVPCLKLAHARLSSACINGPPKLEVIQAISVLTFWKEPSDQNAWRRIGVSIRMAFELGLHQAPRRPLPHDDLEARKILNRERLWFHLQCFDSTTSYQRDLPSMISSEWTRDPIKWMSNVKEDLRILPDYVICCSQPLGGIKQRIRRIHKTLNRIREATRGKESVACSEENPKCAVSRSLIEHQLLEQTLMIADLKADVENWKETWLMPPTTLNIPSHVQQKFAFSYSSASLTLAITTFEHEFIKESMSETPSAAAEKAHHGPCVAACLSLLASVNDLASSGMLLYCQDTVAVAFATAILWLSLHCNVFDTQTVRIVDRAMQETKRLAGAASKQPKDAPAYFARFIENFGQTFERARSRLGSPVPQPVHVARDVLDAPAVPQVNGVDGNVDASAAAFDMTSSSAVDASSSLFPWDQPQPQTQPMPGEELSPEDAALLDLLTTQQSFVDFFSLSTDQNYWTAVAPQAGLQSYLESTPQPDVFSPTTASVLSSHLGW